eukprot:Awhi_evm1s8489
MSDVKKFTPEEIAKHKTSEDCWFVIDGKVYDVSEFMDEHPGGEEALLDEAGKDSTQAFEDIGHSTDARMMLSEYEIGEVDGEMPNAPKAKASVGTGSSEQQSQSG